MLEIDGIPVETVTLDAMRKHIDSFVKVHLREMPKKERSSIRDHIWQQFVKGYGVYLAGRIFRRRMKKNK